MTTLLPIPHPLTKKKEKKNDTSIGALCPHLAKLSY